MSTKGTYTFAAAALAALSISSTASEAQTIAALVNNGNGIVWIDAAARKVTGYTDLAGKANLVGIDVRPANKQLYGLGRDGSIVTINPTSGKLTKRSQLSEKLSPAVWYSVDFNPAADRLRVIGADGTSLRINVEDGKATVDGRLRYAENDGLKGKEPKVAAVAYSNSFAGTKETALYDIDAANGVLVRQAPPNDGILNTIGKLGVKLGSPVAFDIAADGKGGNVGWMVSGATLYSVDIATGAAKSAGRISGLKGTVGDIAILPAD